jgi:hypothetical protein
MSKGQKWFFGSSLFIIALSIAIGMTFLNARIARVEKKYNETYNQYDKIIGLELQGHELLRQIIITNPNGRKTSKAVR